MRHFRIESVPSITALRAEPVPISIYIVDEAIRGVAPPTEWAHPEHQVWFEGFVRRLHRRFIAALTEDQRETICDLANASLDDLYSFYLDPQVPFQAERYRPDPSRNAVTYLRRAYGAGAVRDVCTAVKEATLADPREVLCYCIGNTLRYLEAIL